MRDSYAMSCKFLICRTFSLLPNFSLSVSAQNLSIYCEEVQPAQLIDVDGKLFGFTVEIVQEIQRRVGNTDRIQMVPWARGIEKLKHEPNSLLFSMARTAERDSPYQWIAPYQRRPMACM